MKIGARFAVLLIKLSPDAPKAWPRAGGGIGELAHDLRENPRKLTQQDLNDAADTIDAYRELVYATDSVRKLVCRALRDAEEKAFK